MKILILNKTIGEGSGLTQIVSRELYNTLKEDKHDVYLTDIRGIKDLEHIVKKIEFDIILPCIQFGWSESGLIQEYLDKYQKPYLFSSKEIIEICGDKTKFKTWAKKNKINIPKTYLEANIKFPCIKKPKIGENSAAVKIINNEKKYDDNYLYEEYLSVDDNWTEYTITVLKGKVCSPVLIKKQGSTWNKNNNEEVKYIYDNKDLVFNFIEKDFEDIYKKLNIKSCCTIDFMIKNGEYKILEINALPFLNESGTCIQSIIDKKKISYNEVLKIIIENE